MCILMPLIATIPLCSAYIQPAQTKLLAMEASALGSTEMGQLRGGQLNEVLFNIAPLLELTQAYRSHGSLILSPGARTTKDGSGAALLLTVITQ